MLLRSYKVVLRTIPYHLLDLYEPHIRQTLDLCNPGCFILTWNSLNIDSFLKTVENGIKKLGDLVNFISNSKEAIILDTIEKINNMYLFDNKLAFNKQWVFITFYIFNFEVFISKANHFLESGRIFKRNRQKYSRKRRRNSRSF